MDGTMTTKKEHIAGTDEDLFSRAAELNNSPLVLQDCTAGVELQSNTSDAK